MASKTMTPSESISAGQIGQIQDRVGTALRTSRLQSDPVQQVLSTKGQGDLMIAEMVAVVRKFVEAVSDLIVRLVSVNRGRKPQAALDATGRKQYTDRKVVDAMPLGEGENAEVIFFKVGHYISDDDLEKEYELRGLKPADPFSLAAVNEADPTFADQMPNGTHWKDADGKWCFATFRLWGDERDVRVYRDDGEWDDDWWFAGLRK